jgi:hypothetical protein
MKKHSFTAFTLSAFIAVMSLGSPAAFGTVVFGQIDDFEDDTTMFWAGGAGPANVSTGGPAGAGDNYLQLVATGGNGPGSRLGAYNDLQWTGDYVSEGVTAIEADVRNFGATGSLSLRFLFFGAGGNFTSTVPIMLPNDGLWHHVVFGVTPADLTAVDCGFDVNATLSGTNRLLLRHQVGPPDGQFAGTAVVGELGVDNITAVPEPSALAVLLVCSLALRRRR